VLALENGPAEDQYGVAITKKKKERFGVASDLIRYTISQTRESEFTNQLVYLTGQQLVADTGLLSD
jgi:hypothetical protein